MSFEDRIRMASVHEIAVLERLRRSGWSADLFGQSLLPGNSQTRLRQTKTRLRWLPDIIAFKNGKRCFVDAKSGRLDTRNHAIEIDSVEAQEGWEQFTGFPVIFVCADFGCLTTALIRQFGEIYSSRLASHSHGSGTPFFLIKKYRCLDFDNLFNIP